MSNKLVVAGLAYAVEAESEEQAEDTLLDFLDSLHLSGNNCQIVKLWVSARQDGDDRLEDLKRKEEEALHGE